MTKDELNTVQQALDRMASLIHQLEPDPEYMEMFGVDEVLTQAQEAYDIITKAQGE
jgi:hypothetical protein